LCRIGVFQLQVFGFVGRAFNTDIGVCATDLTFDFFQAEALADAFRLGSRCHGETRRPRQFSVRRPSDPALSEAPGHDRGCKRHVRQSR